MSENDRPLNKFFLAAYSAAMFFVYALAGKRALYGEPSSSTSGGRSSRFKAALDRAVAAERPPDQTPESSREESAADGVSRERQHLDTSDGKHAGTDSSKHMTVPAGLGLQPGEPRQQRLAEGWHTPKPERLPKPTYWPAALAFGVTLLAWGPVTSWIVATVGFIVCAISLAGWIGDLRYER